MGTRDNESMGLTRRGFLTGALALGAVGAGSYLLCRTSFLMSLSL